MGKRTKKSAWRALAEQAYQYILEDVHAVEEGTDPPEYETAKQWLADYRKLAARGAKP